MKDIHKENQKLRRKKRTRGKVYGTKERPRLSVFRSNNFLYAQIINDNDGKTILGVSEKKMKLEKGSKVNRAKSLGLSIAKLAKVKKITKVVFDKGAYSYHGRIKALAEGARQGGLTF